MLKKCRCKNIYYNIQSYRRCSSSYDWYIGAEYVDEDTGKAEVRETFKLSGVGTIAGCYVTSGKVFRGSKVRIVRDGFIIHEGQLAALRRFKDDVKEVNQRI